MPLCSLLSRRWLFSLAVATSMLTAPVLAATGVNDIIELDKPRQKPHVELSLPMEKMQTPIIHGSLSAERQVSLEDVRNLETLWKAILARNPVIQFSLKQLATPPELRFAHASMMSKTVSGLLSGVSMLPMAIGAGGYASGTSMVGAEMMDRAVRQSKKIDPSQLPSDTELVQLSSTVQALQSSLVSNYFDYKTGLLGILQQRDHLAVLAAQDSQNPAAEPALVLWRQAARMDADAAELEARQTAERHFLALERLVGADGMAKLRFDGILPPATAIPEKSAAIPISIPLSATSDVAMRAATAVHPIPKDEMPDLDTAASVTTDPVTMDTESLPLGDIIK